jgi:hypothetical protein
MEICYIAVVAWALAQAWQSHAVVRACLMKIVCELINLQVQHRISLRRLLATSLVRIQALSG